LLYGKKRGGVGGEPVGAGEGNLGRGEGRD